MLITGLGPLSLCAFTLNTKTAWVWIGLKKTQHVCCSDGRAVVDYCCQLTLPFLSSRRHQTFEGRWFILHMCSLFIFVYQMMLVGVCKNRL